mgnify:CR=1 FL=1
MIYAKSFRNMADAFVQVYKDLHEIGHENEDTKRITGALIEIDSPMDWSNMPEWRNWRRSYVDLEWAWYQEATQDPAMVMDVAKIWRKMRDENGLVNSNYGFQVKRNEQWNKCARGIVDAIMTGKGTRKNVVSIYDGKERDGYDFDTPCTISFSFVISEHGLIDIHTHMRSNDIWFGFCNDIPAFALFQQKMVDSVNEILLDELPDDFFKVCTAPGRLVHFVDDLHVYTPQQNKDV